MPDMTGGGRVRRKREGKTVRDFRDLVQKVAAENADFFLGREATAWYCQGLFLLVAYILTQTGEQSNSV